MNNAVNIMNYFVSLHRNYRYSHEYNKDHYDHRYRIGNDNAV